MTPFEEYKARLAAAGKLTPTPARSITFWVNGAPAPAGSKTAFCLRKGGVLTGRAVVTDASGKKGKTWRADIRDALATAALGAGHPTEPLDGALELSVVFHMKRPNDHYRRRNGALELRDDAPLWHTSKPDTTKLLRAVEDALNGLLWRDDSQITQQHATKVYSTGTPGCQITVRTVPEPERTPQP